MESIVVVLESPLRMSVEITLKNECGNHKEANHLHVGTLHTICDVLFNLGIHYKILDSVIYVLRLIPLLRDLLLEYLMARCIIEQSIDGYL